MYLPERYNAVRAGTIQSVSIQYRYRGQPIRIDTVILLYRYTNMGATNMVTAAKMKQLFRKESSCFFENRIFEHLSSPICLMKNLVKTDRIVPALNAVLFNNRDKLVS